MSIKIITIDTNFEKFPKQCYFCLKKITKVPFVRKINSNGNKKEAHLHCAYLFKWIDEKEYKDAPNKVMDKTYNRKEIPKDVINIGKL